MEVFTGNQKIPNPDDFPQHIAPFPEPSNLIYSHPTAVIHSPDMVNHRPISPPQKLRPIRCHARSPVNDFPDNEGLVGTLGKGFLSDQANGAFDGEFECAVKLEAGEVPKTDVCGTTSVMSGDPFQFGSGAFVEAWETNGGDGVLEENKSSSSSDEGVDYAAANFKGPVNRKRRKSRRNLEHFLENLVMKVMEKQELMHKQMIEMMEKMETQRILREEAWKQQEMERIKRDEVARAQEVSRSLALISFLQNLLGEEIRIPESVVEENGVEAETQSADMKCDPNSKIRWPEAEVQALIALRTALEHKFRVTGSKGSIWEEVSVGMYSMGYNRTAKKCKEKWENINKYFKRSTGTGKKRSANAKTCPYFHNLDLLYKNGLVNPGVGVSIENNNADEAKSEKDSESP